MKTETKATLGIIFGVLALIIISPLFGILAVYFGYKAKKDSGSKKGKIGFILGIVSIIFYLFAIISMKLFPMQIFGTTYPYMVYVSKSMEHSTNFDDWWNVKSDWYTNNGIQKTDFQNFPFEYGLNKGDFIVSKGIKSSEIKMGDILAFWSTKKEPILHRVVKIWEENNQLYFGTKGDYNPIQIKSPMLDETRIPSDQIIGKVVFRIPYLGWPKIWYGSLFLG